MSWAKRKLPIYTFALCSFIIVLAYYFPYDLVVDTSKIILQFSVIITAFSLALGALNLSLHHIGHIRKRTPGRWYWSIYVMCLLVPLSLIGIVMGPEQQVYNWVYQNVNLPLGASMWGLIALYILSASFRAFRIKNIDSAILGVSCFFVLLKNAPIGEAIWSGFASIGAWITDIPQTVGTSVFWVGVGLGFIGLFIRVFMGKETAPLGFAGEE